MSRLVRKAKKLLLHPNVFFRDYFMLRAPISSSADINRPRKHDVPARETTMVPGPTSLVDGYLTPEFPIDVVYTWVDANDAAFNERRSEYLSNGRTFDFAATCDARFTNRDELKYSLRSIMDYAPWVRRIFIVTNGQVPKWLRTDHPKVQIVDHRDIIPEEYLPTFNSHVIESCIHRIPDLSEHYVYFNDDVLVLRPLTARDFFTENGLMRGFISNAEVADGPNLDSETPSIWATKNARELIKDKTGHLMSMKFAHTYHPQLKSVAEADEKLFSDAMHKCRSNRFRDKTDILCTSFLHPCMAYVTGKGVFSQTRAWYFNIRDVSARNLYSAMHSMKGDDICPYSVCLNDHLEKDADHQFTDYEDYLAAFLERYYPHPAPFEVAGEEVDGDHRCGAGTDAMPEGQLQ